MAPSKLSLLLIALFALTSSSFAQLVSQPSIYEVLKQFGLPPGVLPDCVTSYSYDPSDSSFVVTLSKPCYVKFDYLVYFETKITGKISYGCLTDLKGLQAQSFVFWLNIDTIKADSTSVYITLGLITKTLDIAQFETVHACKDNALAACELSSGLIRSNPISQLSVSQPSIYEVLKQFGLPSGVLPDCVTSYSYEPSDSSFVVTLAKPCYVKFDYLVYFETKITGKISYGALTDLKGLQAQSFVFWLNIDTIKADSTSVYITLGLITKTLDIAQFETVHACKDNALAACQLSSGFRSNLISQLPLAAEGVDKVIME